MNTSFPAVGPSHRRAATRGKRLRRVAAIATVLAGLPGPIIAMPFDRTYEFPGGFAARYVQGNATLFDYFVTPSVHDPDLEGTLQIRRIEVIGPGTVVKAPGLFDTELYFSNQVPIVSPWALPPGQREGVIGGEFTTFVPFEIAPTQLRYVLRTPVTGPTVFSALFELDNPPVTGTPEFFDNKTAAALPIDTKGTGLYAQLYVWSGDHNARVVLDGISVNIQGCLYDYQLAPNPNGGAILIEECGPVYNEEDFLNTGTVVAHDGIENRNGARISNLGTIELGALLTNRIGAELINEGLIDVTPAGRIVNAGRVTNRDGGVFRLEGAFENETAATLLNEGLFEILPGGHLDNRTGATIVNAGTLIQQAGAEALDNNATITVTSEGLLEIHADLYNRSDASLNVSGQLRVGGSGRIVNALSSSSIELTGPLARLEVQAGGRVLDVGGLVRASAGARVENRGNFETFGVLELADQPSAFLNHGVLDIHKTLQISGRFTNDGSVTTEINGSWDIRSTGVIDNFGSMDLQGSVANTGMVHNHPGGTVGFASVFNRGHVLNEALMHITQASFHHLEARLENATLGTLDVTANGRLRNLAEISNQGFMTVRGRYTGEAGSVLRNVGTLEFNAPSATVDVLTSAGLIENPGFLRVLAGSKLRNTGTIETSGDFHIADNGLVSNAGLFVNTGMLRVDGTLASFGGVFTQTGAGAITFANGRIEAAEFDLTQGALQGNGKIFGSVVARNGAKINPGSSPGTLTIDGQLVLDGGTLEFEYAGGTARDRLVVNGAFDVLGGEVAILLQPGYVPGFDDGWRWLSSESGVAVAGALALGLNAYGLPVEWMSELSPRGGGLHVFFLPEAAYRLPEGGHVLARVVAIGDYAYVDGQGYFNGGSFDNHGQLSVRPDTTFVNTADFRNHDGAMLLNRGLVHNESVSIEAYFGNFGTLHNFADAVFMNDGAIDNHGMFTNDGELQMAAGILFNQAGATFRNDGLLRYQTSIENQGIFIVGTAGLVADFDEGLGEYLQTGDAGGSTAVTRVDGRLAAAGASILAGTLSGAGTLAVEGALNLANARVAPGNSIGTLTIEGAVEISPDPPTLFSIEIAGIDDFDRIRVTDLVIGFEFALVEYLFLPGAAPFAGAAYAWFEAAGGLDVLPLETTFYLLDPFGGRTLLDPALFQAFASGTAFGFSVLESAPVPVPAAAWLLGSAIVSFAPFVRGRARRSA